MRNLIKFNLIVILISIITSSLKAESYGLLMIVKGNVQVVKKTKEKTDAKVGLKILPSDTIITGKESRAKIVMSDRNIINVLPETTLIIEKYINDGTNKNVSLKLIEGKVRNNVEQKYDNDKNKFEVKTVTAVAGVRGTQFITSFDSKTKLTQVITLKGEVMFKAVAQTGNLSKTEENQNKEQTSSENKSENSNTDTSSNTSTDKNQISETKTDVNTQDSTISSDVSGSSPQTQKSDTNEGVIVKKGETSSVQSGSQNPAPPVKVNNQEMKRIESESAVSKKNDNANLPAVAVPTVKNEVKQIITTTERNDNSLTDTTKQNQNNNPARVIIVPEQK